MKPETWAHIKKAVWSYLRAALAAIGALVLAGIEDPGTITISALIAGALGPLVRALDPNDDAYGIGASIEEAYKTAKDGEELFEEDEPRP
jgi:hypothetical protein